MPHFLLLLYPLATSAVWEMSKCMKNHMKTNHIREQEQNLGDDDMEPKFTISTVLDETIGNCVPAPTVPAIYSAECKTLTSEDAFASEKSFLVDFNNGRLGNQLSSFASVFALAKLTGLRVMLTHSCQTILSTYFSNLPFPVLEQTYCHPCTQFNFHPLGEDTAPILHGQAYRLAAAYSNMIPQFAQHLPQLRSMLAFKPEYVAAARKLLEEAAAEMGFASPTFVGLHNRRTDYKSHMMAYGEDFVGPEYFQSALKLFRKTLKNPVFLVVTDDMPWARRHITGRDVFYSAAEAASQTSKENAGQFGAGVDLATLASCNHTIITYGTFGLWGSLLSGGATIISTRSVVLKGLIERADLSQFVFVNEEQKWESFQRTVSHAIHSVTLK